MPAACLRWLVACGIAILSIAPGARGESWTISPPVIKGQAPEKAPAVQAAPLKKDEAREAEELRRVTLDKIYVEGIAESDSRKAPPQTKEQRFAAALNAGNPEVNGGKIRHGMFYDGGVYWAPEPLAFIYYNIVNRFKD